MKIRIAPKSKGNTLMLVIFMTGLMGVSLASYLLLVRYQNLSIMRSVAWNTCIPMSEAGIEEAMTHINRSTISNLNSAGWTLSNGVYTKTRYMGSNYYTVTISSADPPVVVSEGHSVLPAILNTQLGWLADITTPSSSSSGYAVRRVRVGTTKDGLWAKAMVAKKTINLNGNDVATDSFDSTNPSYSTGGLYDSTKRNSNGDVATDSQIINSLNVGNANINGRASTGPGGTVSIGPNGAVGDLNWNAYHTGIEPGWSSDDMNVYFGPVKVPFNAGFTPSSGTIGTTTYKLLLTGGDYVTDSIEMSSSDVMMVTGQVRMLVKSSIKITGNAYIQIAPGASLQLYMDGASANIAGNGVVNGTGNALNFLYLGTDNHTSLNFSGNGTFTGAIYAPNADFSLGGGGSTIQDFIGASVSNTVTMNGHFHFHYDENLGRAGWARAYLINSWNEIQPSS